ncbi:NADPH-dependent 7-cyano-7-deazaguanine reductase [Bacteroidia bacterium]|nr:NADPH-dependent 7-cyano-7-deazaguanine reductase [Bacteroidia bacterium]
MSKNNLQSSQLGKNSHISATYVPDVLFRIARAENRTRYRINDNILPFWGVDVWNCYEFSCLTDAGLPVQRIAKIVVPCESRFLVESKSLKLYLNSLNFTKLGKAVADCTANAEKIIKTDLEHLLECEISVKLFDNQSNVLIPFQKKSNNPPSREPTVCVSKSENLLFADLTELVKRETDLQNIEFKHFTETPELLSGKKVSQNWQYAFRTDVLRSNCPVTGQPDWGDLFVYMKAAYKIDFQVFLQYLVSFRRENHFHEEVVEMIFKRLLDKFCPEELMTAAMYERRGGIDINPIRTTHKHLIDSAFTSTDALLAKTWRQ